MAAKTIITNGELEINNGMIAVSVYDSQGLPLQLRPRLEEWRRRVQSALNEARDLRRAGDPRAEARGVEAMREYGRFASQNGAGSVRVFTPDDSREPRPRMTARRQDALRDARRLFRMRGGAKSRALSTA